MLGQSWKEERSLRTGMAISCSPRQFGRLRCLRDSKEKWSLGTGMVVPWCPRIFGLNINVTYDIWTDWKENRSLGTGMLVPWSPSLFCRLRCLDEGKAVSRNRDGGPLVS